MRTNGVATATDRRPSISSRPPGEARAQGRLRDQVDPQQAVESAVQHPHRHEHARGRGRLAIGVGLPGVHRGQAGLRPVADQREDDAELERERMELVGQAHEPGPVQAGHPLPEEAPAGGEEQHRSQEREGEAEAAEHEELPRRLQRGVPVVEGDHEDGHEGGQLHGDPEDAEVVGDGDEQHREDVERHQRVELTPPPRRHESRADRSRGAPAAPARAAAYGPRRLSSLRRR